MFLLPKNSQWFCIVGIHSFVAKLSIGPDGTVSLRSVGRLFVHLTVLSIYSVMIYILIAPISCIYNNISAYVSHNARDTHTP